MSEQELAALTEKLNKGLEASYEALLRKKAMLGQYVITTDSAGKCYKGVGKGSPRRISRREKITSSMELFPLCRFVKSFDGF